MTKEDKEKSEQRFQYLLENMNDKKCWDELYYLVEWACGNVAKSMLKGIKISPETLEMRYQDAVFEVLEKIKFKGIRPNNLGAYIYWPVRRALIGNRALQEDRETISYELWSEYKYKEEI